MKRICLVSCLVSLLTATPCLAADTGDVRITVYGKVEAKPCTISTVNTEVRLGNLYTFNFVSAGATSPWHKFELNLTNCPIGTSLVTASFDGIEDISGYYKNTGTAGSIQLELQDDAGTVLSKNSKKVLTVDETSQSVTIPLQVRAITVNGGVTKGTIKSEITVTYTWS